MSSDRGSGRRPGQGPWIAAIALLMGGFLGWLLFEWVSYLQGESALLYIVGTAAAGAIAAMVSFAHR